MLLCTSIGEQQKRQREASKATDDRQKVECAANAKQMQAIVKREQKTEVERRLDRQKADDLSKSNSRLRRESKLGHFCSTGLTFLINETDIFDFFHHF